MEESQTSVTEAAGANLMTATAGNLQASATEADMASGVAEVGIHEQQQQQTLAVCLADGDVQALPADQQIIIQIVPVDGETTKC